MAGGCLLCLQWAQRFSPLQCSSPGTVGGDRISGKERSRTASHSDTQRVGRAAFPTEKPRHGHDLPWSPGKHLHFHQETFLILTPTHLSSSSLSVLPLFLSLSCSLTPLLCAYPSSLFLIPSPLFLHLLSCPVPPFLSLSLLSVLTSSPVFIHLLPCPVSLLHPHPLHLPSVSSSSLFFSSVLTFLPGFTLLPCPHPLLCPVLTPFSILSSSSALTLLSAFLFPQPFHLPVSCLC